MVEGHEVWHLKCLGCGRKVKHPADPKNPNALVGKQRRLRCSKCGHLGAEITRVWKVGPAPSKVRP